MRTILLTSAALLLVSAHIACAQTATQTVSYQVAATNTISVSGSPSLVINTATAGSAPTAATASATYAITTNETNRKITATLDLAMPSGVTLGMSMAAPTGGTSAGTVTLSTVAQNMVTGISTLNQSGLAITYTLNATAAAGVVPAGNRTVTLTITAGV